MGWKIEFGPCHGEKRVGRGSAGWWVAASTAKDESRQFSQLSGG